MIWPVLVSLAAMVMGSPAPVVCPAYGAEWQADPNRQLIQQVWGFDPSAYADIAGRRIVLGPYACGGAVLLAADPNNNSGLASVPNVQYREAFGLFALLHEMGHLVNGRDEHGADCFALAHYEDALKRLGVLRERAEWFLRYAESIHADNPPPYAGPCP
jgi:hypothetical protein